VRRIRPLVSSFGNGGCPELTGDGNCCVTCGTGDGIFADGVDSGNLFVCIEAGMGSAAWFTSGVTGILPEGVGTPMRGCDTGVSGLVLIAGCLPELPLSGPDILGSGCETGERAGIFSDGCGTPRIEPVLRLEFWYAVSSSFSRSLS